MSNNQKYIALPGGKECKPKNPYRQYRLAFKEPIISPEWQDFEDTAPTYALTEVMPEGETFVGSEVWQWCEPNTKGWHTEHATTMFDNFEDYSGHCATIFMMSRKAIKPLKVIEPVKGIVIPADFVANADKYFGGVDVVENKETVDYNVICQSELDKFNSEFKEILAERNLSIKDLTNVYFRQGFISGQQSQFIEGIVGFVLEWVAENVDTVTDDWGYFKSIDTIGIKNMKSDIIKEYNNGK